MRNTLSYGEIPNSKLLPHRLNRVPRHVQSHPTFLALIRDNETISLYAELGAQFDHSGTTQNPSCLTN